MIPEAVHKNPTQPRWHHKWSFWCLDLFFHYKHILFRWWSSRVKLMLARSQGAWVNLTHYNRSRTVTVLNRWSCVSKKKKEKKSLQYSKCFIQLASFAKHFFLSAFYLAFTLQWMYRSATCGAVPALSSELQPTYEIGGMVTETKNMFTSPLKLSHF